MSAEEPTPAPHSRRSTTTSRDDNSSGAESISLPHSDTPSRSKSRHDNNFQTHEEIFNQHNDQIQQIFDNRHHDINFDDDGTASWDEESLGNSSLSSLDDASLSELRSALIARRQRILDEGSVTKKRHRRGHSLDGSWGSLSFASLTGSLTSLTRRRKKKKKSKDKDKDKSKKKKKKKKKKSKDGDKDSSGGEEKKKSKKKKSKDGDGKKKTKRGDDDDGSLKRIDKKKSSKQKIDDGDTLGTSGRSLDKSGRSWERDKSSSKNRSLFNLNMSMGNNNDSHAFVFYACDENTGCCAFHPEIQLRKKARLGGWVDVLKQCPKCNDPKGDDNSSLRRGGDNASWRRDDDNSSLRRRERDNPSLRRRDDDNSSLRRRDDDNSSLRRRDDDNSSLRRRRDGDTRNLRSRGDERLNLESNRRQSTRNMTEGSSRHSGLDRERARGKSQRMSEYLHDRREGRINRDRDAIRRDLHHGPPRRDLHHTSSRRDLNHTSSRRNDLDYSARSNRSKEATGRATEYERGHRDDPRRGYSDRHNRNDASKRHLDRDPSKRVVREPSKRVNEPNRHRPRRRRDSSSSSSDSSSSSSSSSSDYVRPKSRRPTDKPASTGKGGDKSTKKSKVATSSDRHDDLKKGRSGRNANLQDTQKVKTKTSRGRTVSPPKSSHQIPSMKDIHQHLRKQSNSRSRSKDRSNDVFIDPTYKYAQDHFEDQMKQPQLPRQTDISTSDNNKKRPSSPSRRESVDSNGRPKPLVFKPVDFNPPPTAKYSGTESDHSFNESIEFASYRKLSKESFEDNIYSTDPEIANDAFEADFADSNSNFSNTLDAVNSDEKASKEEGLSSVFEEAIQSVNPKLFETINNSLKEEQEEGDKTASYIKHGEDRKRVSKSLGHAYQLSSNPDQYNISATSLNVSEPSLMETSAEVSPKIPEATSRVTDHRRTQSFHPDVLYSRQVFVPEEKSKSLHPDDTVKAQTNIDHSDRSYFSVERSVSGSFSRGNLKEMTKEQMLAFASFESIARKKGKANSNDKKSFDAKASGTSENAHKSVEISSSLIDQVVRRLSSVGSADGSTDEGPKDMALKDLMKFYAENDDASGSNNSSTVVTNLHWKGIGMYTGQVNEKIEPHGQGQLVMHSGATLYGQWSNGRPVSNNDSVNHSKEQEAEGHAKKEKTSKEAPEKAAMSETSAYKLGDEGRRRDMIKENDKEASISRISKFQKGDPAFIRRTDGAWTFARVKSIAAQKDIAYFVVNSSGSTKSYKSKYWHSHIRACRIPNEQLPSYESPKRRSSSNESLMSDSDMSELVDMLRQPMLEEPSREKSTAPPRTFEIKEIREYEPTKNRFCIKDLMKQAQLQHATQSPAKGRESPIHDNSEDNNSMGQSHQDRRLSIDCSETSRETAQDDRSTTSKSLLRKGRFSFHEEDKPYVSMKRSVSFSKEQETRSYTKDDVADDISTKTEDDEDDNFDVNGLISSTRAGSSAKTLNLRGIEP